MNRKSLAALLWLALGILPAAADSREEAQERMARCNSLTDMRQYLDCIYGAVQPIRSELGLPPAPQAAGFTAFFAGPPVRTASAAQPAQQPEKPGLLGSLLSDVTGTSTRAVAPEQFGLRNARPGPGRNVDRITARMKEFSLDRRTRAFTITLENGQVWRRDRSEDPLPSWRGAATSYVATISYGALGTFNLNVAGDPNLYKVQRIR